MVVNDNLGIIIAGLFRAPSALVKTVVLKNKDNNPVNINVFATDSGNLFNDTNVSVAKARIRIGKGTTPATRQDFDIETPFSTSPESAWFNVIGTAGWNSGLGQISIGGGISATGSGAISESAYSTVWRATDSAHHRSLFSRDNISPVVNFINGETINVNYVLLMS